MRNIPASYFRRESSSHFFCCRRFTRSNLSPTLTHTLFLSLSHTHTTSHTHTLPLSHTFSLSHTLCLSLSSSVSICPGSTRKSFPIFKRLENQPKKHTFFPKPIYTRLKRTLVPDKHFWFVHEKKRRKLKSQRNLVETKLWFCRNILLYQFLLFKKYPNLN